MNKNITLLILLAILGAQLLVFFSHMQRQVPEAEPAPMNTVQMQAVVEENHAVESITPPIANVEEQASNPLAGGVSTPSNNPVSENSLFSMAVKPTKENQSSTVDKSIQELAEKPATQGRVDGANTLAPTLNAPVAISESLSNQNKAEEDNAATNKIAPSGQEITAESVLPVGIQDSALQEIKPVTPANVSGQGETPQAGQEANAKKPELVSEVKDNKASSLVIEDISFKYAGQKLHMVLKANAEFEVRVFDLAAPDRVVVDLLGIWENFNIPNMPENPVAKKARVGKQPHAHRLVIDMAKPLQKREVVRSGNSLELVMW